MRPDLCVMQREGRRSPRRYHVNESAFRFMGREQALSMNQIASKSACCRWPKTPAGQKIGAPYRRIHLCTKKEPLLRAALELKLIELLAAAEDQHGRSTETSQRERGRFRDDVDLNRTREACRISPCGQRSATVIDNTVIGDRG
jgi:hypothetical protein